MPHKKLEEVLDKVYDGKFGQDSETLAQQVTRIYELREEKDAVILAHYYQRPIIQEIADFEGDSLQLAQIAQKLDPKKLVVSCTVYFMAEMVKLLSPKSKVIIPDLTASCSIAEGMNGATVRKIKEKYPTAAVVGYINTLAETKKEFDSVCTSANALQIVQRIPGHSYSRRIFCSQCV